MLWYKKHHYQSQNWYSSTFLVHYFKDISKVDRRKGEWNNIEESGCHFVCLSMMLGVNPAYLASKLRENRKHYFLSDSSLSAKRLNSGENTKLVWDRNYPSSEGEYIEVKNIYLPSRGFCNVSLELKNYKQTHELHTTTDSILKAKKKGLHIICGSADHSLIIVGSRNKNNFLFWDPDTSEMNVKEVHQMIDEGLKLTKVVNEYKISENNPLQVLEHEFLISPVKI